MLLRLLYRILLVLGLVFALDLVYEYTLFQNDLENNCPELLQINSEAEKTDIYYFGESSNVTPAPYDTSTKSISDLLQDHYPELRVTNINKYATHAGIYRAWIDQIGRSGKMPRAIVVTLNLRSFGAAWIHSNLESALQQSIVFSKPGPPLLNRFMLALKAEDETGRDLDVQRAWKNENLEFPFSFRYHTVREWDDGMANGGHLKPDGSWDIPKIELACHYIKAYAFNVKEKNPRLQDLDYIFDWCGENGVPLYYNLMSENTAYADSLVGGELVFLMRKNRDLLVRRYNKAHCRVADNLESVPPQSFIDKSWTTEHYDLKGRMVIARNLADTMRHTFSQFYKEAY